MSTLTALPHKVLGPGDGLRIESGPGRDLIFKVTGEDTGGAIDYLTVEVAPRGGPPLHVHHTQDELIQAVKGRYKVKIDGAWHEGQFSKQWFGWQFDGLDAEMLVVESRLSQSLLTEARKTGAAPPDGRP